MHVQWGVLMGFRTIKLVAAVYGMYEVNTCSLGIRPCREPLTSVSASSSQRAVAGYFCHRTSLLCTLGGHVCGDKHRPQRVS